MAGFNFFYISWDYAQKYTTYFDYAQASQFFSWRTTQLQTFQPQASIPNLSTLDFSRWLGLCNIWHIFRKLWDNRTIPISAQQAKLSQSKYSTAWSKSERRNKWLEFWVFGWNKQSFFSTWLSRPEGTYNSHYGNGVPTMFTSSCCSA